PWKHNMSSVEKYCSFPALSRISMLFPQNLWRLSSSMPLQRYWILQIFLQASVVFSGEIFSKVSFLILVPVPCRVYVIRSGALFLRGCHPLKNIALVRLTRTP